MREGIAVNVQTTPRIDVTLALGSPLRDADGHRPVAAAADAECVGRHDGRRPRRAGDAAERPQRAQPDLAGAVGRAAGRRRRQSDRQERLCRRQLPDWRRHGEPERVVLRRRHGAGHRLRQHRGADAESRLGRGVQRPDQQQQRRVRPLHRRRRQHGLALGHQRASAAACSSTTATGSSTPTRSSASGPGWRSRRSPRTTSAARWAGRCAANKLFFFSSYEGYRNEEGILLRRTVPTAAMRNGDFSDFRNQTTGAVVPIYDPWTQCGINNPGTGAYNGDCGTVPNRLQFPGNMIPANRINPIARAVAGLPDLRRPDRVGPVAQQQLREERPDRRRQQPVQSPRRLQREPERPHDRPLHPIFESTNAPVDLYGNGQLNGDPYSPEHFITTQAMLASTWTINSTTVFDARFGFLRWDYDREPGNLGINLTQTFGFAQTPYGRDLRAQRHPGDGDDSEHRRSPTTTPSTPACIYADDRTYTFTPTLTKITGDHTHQGRRQPAARRGQLLPEQQPRRHVHLHQRADGARRHQPRRHGRPVRGVPARAAHRRHLPGLELHLRSLALPGLLRRRLVAGERQADREPRAALGDSRRLHRPGRQPEHVQSRRGQPAADRDHESGHRAAVPRRLRAGEHRRAARARPEEEPARSGRAARRLRVSAHAQHGDPRRRRQVHRPLDGAVPGRPDQQRHQQPRQQYADQRRQQPDVHRRPEQPVPERRARTTPAATTASSRRCWAAARNQFICDHDGYPGSAYQWNIAVQHQFGSDLSVEATYTGLDGNHLPNSLNYNQLGLEHVNRAANDTTRVQPDRQRDHPARRARLRVEPARHLLRRLPAPAGAPIRSSA